MHRRFLIFRTLYDLGSRFAQRAILAGIRLPDQPRDHGALDHPVEKLASAPIPDLGETTYVWPSHVNPWFHNKRGTAEQWIKEGKQAVNMTRLSCHRFRSNEVRLWLSLMAHNLGNLWRRLVLPKTIHKWSLASLQQRLVKTGGRLVKHARYCWLLLAESHLTRRLFGAMVRKDCRLTGGNGLETEAVHKRNQGKRYGGVRTKLTGMMGLAHLDVLCQGEGGALRGEGGSLWKNGTRGIKRIVAGVY